MVLIEPILMGVEKVRKGINNKIERNNRIRYVEKGLMELISGHPDDIRDSKKNTSHSSDNNKTDISLAEAKYKEVQLKINELYDKDKGIIDKLKIEVEMLTSILVAAPNLVGNGIKTVEKIKAEIKEHKNNITDILGIEIKLQKPIEDFLSKDN